MNETLSDVGRFSKMVHHPHIISFHILANSLQAEFLAAVVKAAQIAKALGSDDEVVSQTLDFNPDLMENIEFTMGFCRRSTF